MLVVDSDGFAERDFLFIHPLLNDGAVLIFDDYQSSQASGKTERVAPFVDDMLGRGVFSQIALLPWGTWFGQLMRRPRPEEIAVYRDKWRTDAWPWLDFLDKQRKSQHLPRAKEVNAKLLPFQFVKADAHAEDETKAEEMEAYSRVRSTN